MTFVNREKFICFDKNANWRQFYIQINSIQHMMASGDNKARPHSSKKGRGGYPNFIYRDSDAYQNEIAEFYTYFENDEMELNYSAYQHLIINYRKMNSNWSCLEEAEQLSFVKYVCEFLEIQDNFQRTRAERCLLYLAQGCFSEVEKIQEQQLWTRRNVLLFAQVDILAMLVSMLKYEIHVDNPTGVRLIITIIYIITEVNRNELGATDYQASYKTFQHDILRPFNGELLLITLFDLVNKFTNGQIVEYPVKKILLLIWKIILLGLGGMEKLRFLKNKKRLQAGLAPVLSHSVLRSTPLMTNESLSDLERKQHLGSLRRSYTELNVSRHHKYNELRKMCSVQRYPSGHRMRTKEIQKMEPKYYEKDLDNYLNYNRQKYFGFTLERDHDTLIGLPDHVQKMAKVIKRHMYIRLSDGQKKNHRASPQEQADATEILYESMFPHLRYYLISLLKIFLYAIPDYVPKTSVFDILPEIFLNNTDNIVYEDYKVDIQRHKEILLKAISAILLLLMKHFKLNHIYQYEFVGQGLLCANCLNLITVFLSSNIGFHIIAHNSFAQYEFPQFHIYDDSDESGEAGYCWRNLFSLINILRIFQKLIKWKNYRILTSVDLKSPLLLKRLLKISVPMVEYYTLKVLRLQVRYCDKRWRRANMTVISRIYKSIRHYMDDKWLAEYDPKHVPSLYVHEEESLLDEICKFHSTRYPDSD